MKTDTIKKRIEKSDIDQIEAFLKSLKQESASKFNAVINKLKVIFINSDDILTMNKIALVFSTFLVHSAVPLIISKLVSNKFNSNGGTLLFSIKNLRKHEFKEELHDLRKQNISYEMQQMLEMNNIS